MDRLFIIMLFCLAVRPAAAQRGRDTFKLYFDLNVTRLNAEAEKRIDLLIYNDKIINGSSIMIIGYADYLGSEKYNKGLSMKRAQNILDYLVKYGIDAKYIKLVEGKGEIDKGIAKKGGIPYDRRVDIVVNNVPRKLPQKPKTPPPQNVNVSSADDIKKLKPGSIFRLKNVYFPANRHIIRPESIPTLELLVKALKDNPKLKISIEGHVCCIDPGKADALDDDTQEIKLSVNRAKAIYYYLLSKGIEEYRLQYEGFGKRRPLVPVERTAQDAEQNRRVEIRVMENK